MTLQDLNPKRRRVVELVADGMRNREIAEAVGTTEHMVKNYLREIYEELGFSNRVELALWYVNRTES